MSNFFTSPGIFVEEFSGLKDFYDFCGIINSLCYIPAPSKGLGMAFLRKTVESLTNFEL
jgi:hypothetical protein